MTATSKTTSVGVISFDVVCPYCLGIEATVTLDLANVNVLTCSGCDEQFSPQQARDKAAETVARWDRVVRWVEAAAALAAESGE